MDSIFLTMAKHENPQCMCETRVWLLTYVPLHIVCIKFPHRMCFVRGAWLSDIWRLSCLSAPELKMSTCST